MTISGQRPVQRGNTFTHRTRRPRWRRWLLRAVAVCVLAVAGLAAIIVLQARLSLPAQQASATVTGLDRAASITRDANGVPTIRANTLRDGYFALGYAHAQDRLVQMELMRRVGSGRLAELIGGMGLPSDRVTRTLGLYRAAQASWTALDAPTQQALLAYADGVNAWLSSPDFHRPPELFWLGDRPEPWQPADSLVWGKLMALSLAGNQSQELARARLDRILPPDTVEKLIDPPLDGSPASTDTARAATVSPVLAALGGFAQDLPEPWQPQTASNAFAVGGGRSASGRPVLANDPHLQLGFPILWYLARIETPDRTVMGGTVPGVPFVLSGRNRHLAWGLTTTGADVQDLVLEHVEPDGRVQRPGGAVAVTFRQETIRQRGAAPLVLTVRETPAGPIVSDLRPDLAKLVGTSEALAFSWTGLLPDDRTAQALLGLAESDSVAAAMTVLPAFTSPPQNVTLADDAGHIAFVAAGRIPLRQGRDGRRIADGALGESGFTQFLPFDRQPQALDPPAGMVFNANNAVLPPGDPRYIGDRYDPGFRAARLGLLLGTAPAMTVAGAAAIQTDDVDPAAGRLLPWLLDAPAHHPLAGAAKALLRNWDLRTQPERPQPLIFAYWLRELTALPFDDDLGEAAGVLSRPDAVLALHLADGSLAAFCDLTSTPDRAETCADLAGMALDRTLMRLAARYGNDPAAWRWGAEHVAALDHPLLSKLLPPDWLGPRPPVPGDNFTLNRASTNESDPRAPFADVHGPGLRAVHDLADLEASRFIIAGGQSGNLASPQSHSFVADWAAGRLRPLPARMPGEAGTATIALMPAAAATPRTAP